MNKTLKLLIIICVLALTIGAVSSCGITDLPSGPPGEDNAPTDTDNPQENRPVKLDTPVIAVIGDTVLWSVINGAVGYEIDNGGSIESVGADVYNIPVSQGDSVRVRAVGDGLKFLTSDWSTTVSYGDADTHSHADGDNNYLCDLCDINVAVVIDFYAVNDLHGKFCDTDKQPGVDELATYLNNAKKTDDHAIIFSSGDMWQGSAESNLTGGILLTEWMNEMGFAAMTLGNHEFDWGEELIRENLQAADFPFLAINIYDNSTGRLADYCTPSVYIDLGDVQIGIIGAIGNCYSSISSDRVSGIHFKTGAALANLVAAEAEKLTARGADFIVYSIHDGYSGGSGSVSTGALGGYYQSILGDYVDIVFEGHSHSSYVLRDDNGTYHLQGGGENKGISHAEIKLNSANRSFTVSTAEVVSSSKYSSLEDDIATENLEDKYGDIITEAYSELGKVTYSMSSGELADYVSQLYLEAGIDKWGDKYNIVLGGGYIKPRSPYNLSSGPVCYADILSLFPFDNRLVLCSISGRDLTRRFINASGDYHTFLSEYGAGIKNNIVPTETYYVIVDTYTQLYPSNNLNVVEYYDDTTFARDLLAKAIKDGKLEIKTDVGSYTLTEISELLEIGADYYAGERSEDFYYVQGTVIDTPHSVYGNLTLSDGNGNTIYIYGLYDTSANRYKYMSDKPVQGDTIIVYAPLVYYVNGDTAMLELKNAVLIKIV